MPELTKPDLTLPPLARRLLGVGDFRGVVMALTAYKTVAMFMRHVYIEAQALVPLDQRVEIVV